MRGKPDVGAIVVGCFIAALVIAIGLLAVPFAGARENVVSAVVLLTFAAALALMATLSVRWTDQPQRWAIGPAVVLACFGVGLLAWPDAVAHDMLAWVWSAALLALAAWMLTRVHRELHSRLGRWILYPALGVLALAAVSSAYETGREAADRRAFPMPGQLVDVGGYRLHLNCTGTGSPTVVLLPGFAGYSSTWGWIAPAVARDSRVCSYDRAGRAWSDAAAGPQDGIALVTDLHALLANAHITGPYVLVGHSLGGLAAMTYAARYPDDVAGVVLLDGTSPDMFTGIAAYPRVYEGFRRVSALFPSLARFGVGRVAYRSSFDAAPASARGEQLAFSSTARLARSERDEWAEAPALMRQAHALRSLSGRPLFVLTAGRGAETGWIPLQDALATLSTNSVHRILPDADHASLVESEAVAAQSTQAIRDVVQSARTGQPLTRL